MGAMTLGAGPNTPACRPLPTGRAVPQPTARVYLAGRGCCAGTWGGLGRAPRRARPRESWAHVQGEFPGGRLGGQWRRTTVEKYPWEARKRRSGRSLWAGEPGVHGPAPAGRLLTPVRASRPSSNGPSPWGRPVSTHSQGCLSLCSRSLSPAPHCGTCPPPPWDLPWGSCNFLPTILPSLWGPRLFLQPRSSRSGPCAQNTVVLVKT